MRKAVHVVLGTNSVVTQLQLTTPGVRENTQSFQYAGPFMRYAMEDYICQNKSNEGVRINPKL